MNRRGFLGILAAAAATAVLDPERLLWRPGERTHILPPAGGWGVKGVHGRYGCLKPGDVFTIDGVFLVNPSTPAGPKITPFLQQFVVVDEHRAWPEPPAMGDVVPLVAPATWDDVHKALEEDGWRHGLDLGKVRG